MGARVYDPYTGTFTQPDPIQGGGANAYGYTDGDPVNQFDLTGELPSWVKAVAVVVLGPAALAAAIPAAPYAAAGTAAYLQARYGGTATGQRVDALAGVLAADVSCFGVESGLTAASCIAGLAASVTAFGVAAAKGGPASQKASIATTGSGAAFACEIGDSTGCATGFVGLLTQILALPTPKAHHRK